MEHCSERPRRNQTFRACSPLSPCAPRICTIPPFRRRRIGCRAQRQFNCRALRCNDGWTHHDNHRRAYHHNDSWTRCHYHHSWTRCHYHHSRPRRHHDHCGTRDNDNRRTHHHCRRGGTCRCRRSGRWRSRQYRCRRRARCRWRKRSPRNDGQPHSDFATRSPWNHGTRDQGRRRRSHPLQWPGQRCA
jgi:hypothetical protein